MGFPGSVFFIPPKSSAPTEEAQSRLAKAMEIDFMDVFLACFLMTTSLSLLFTLRISRFTYQIFGIAAEMTASASQQPLA
jgi:hypothetical protein